MRYDKLRKTDRNNAIIEYHKAHPGLSLREIAKAFNITRQRVFKIIKRGY